MKAIEEVLLQNDNPQTWGQATTIKQPYWLLIPVEQCHDEATTDVPPCQHQITEGNCFELFTHFLEVSHHVIGVNILLSSHTQRWALEGHLNKTGQSFSVYCTMKIFEHQPFADLQQWPWSCVWWALRWGAAPLVTAPATASVPSETLVLTHHQCCGSSWHLIWNSNCLHIQWGIFIFSRCHQ